MTDTGNMDDILSHNTFRIITGLVNATQHNGRRCYIQAFIGQSGRYQCVVGGTLDNPAFLNVQPANLREAVAEDFVPPPADAFNGIHLPPLRPGETAVIAYPDMIMFQPFYVLSLDGLVGTMMMNRDTWMAQYFGHDGLPESALHLLENGYPSPRFFQYIQIQTPV